MHPNLRPINPNAAKPKKVAKDKEWQLVTRNYIIKAQAYDKTMCLTLGQVYPDVFVKKYAIGHHSNDNGGVRKRRQRQNSVLMCAVRYILSHIILYDSYYVSPYPGENMFVLKMSKKPQWEVNHIVENKPTKYRRIDLIRTKGVINEVVLVLAKEPIGQKTRRVHVSKDYWQAIAESVNGGKVYDSKLTNFKLPHKQLLDHVSRTFPDASRRKLDMIVRFGLMRIGKFSRLGHGVDFRSVVTNFFFKTYTYKYFSQEEKERINAVVNKSVRANKAGELSPHQILLKNLTWRRTKTHLKKDPS